MSFVKKMWRNYTKVFAKTPLHPQFFTKGYLINDIKRSTKYAKGTMIDIGCGFKPYKRFFADNVDHYFGLDYPASPESMDEYASEPPDIYADAMSLPIKSDGIDTILLTQVLEHVPGPELTLAEVKRVLKKRGILFVSVPLLYPIHSAPYDYYRYTIYGIRYLMDKYGFSIESESMHGGVVVTLALSINVFLMHKLFNLTKNKLTAVFGLILAPVVFITATVINLIAYILKPLDRERRFTTNYFIVAKKK